MKRRDYRDYLQDILDSIKDIESFVENMDFEDFSKDKKTTNAVIRSIEVIGGYKEYPLNLLEIDIL